MNFFHYLLLMSYFIAGVPAFFLWVLIERFIAGVPSAFFLWVLMNDIAGAPFDFFLWDVITGNHFHFITAMDWDRHVQAKNKSFFSRFKLYIEKIWTSNCI